VDVLDRVEDNTTMAVLDEVEGMMTCGRLNIYGTCQSIE
jgi:hypothetical protein